MDYSLPTITVTWGGELIVINQSDFDSSIHNLDAAKPEPKPDKKRRKPEPTPEPTPESEPVGDEAA